MQVLRDPSKIFLLKHAIVAVLGPTIDSQRSKNTEDNYDELTDPPAVKVDVSFWYLGFRNGH